MTSTLEAIAGKITAGGRLAQSDAQALMAEPDLVGLGMLAEDARRVRHGDRVTFLRVAHLSVSDAVGSPSVPGVAGEVRLEGTLSSVDEAAAALRAATRCAGSAPVAAFSLTQLSDLARGAGIPLADCLSRLREAGLERVAEASLDWPGFETAYDAAVAADIEVSRLVFDDGEADWIAGVQRWAERLGGEPSPRALAPLSRSAKVEASSTGYQDLKRVAVARLLVPHVHSIQVDWTVCGPKLAQVALTFGVDDVDNVAVVDDAAMGPRRAALEDVQRNIRAAGLAPVERDGRWELRPEE